MEDDTRSFVPVKIGMLAVETGASRFTDEHGIFNPPPVSRWRNNLTALSHRYNLYFQASNNYIAVYQPEFPYQKLHRFARLVIAPVLANPNARGFIDLSSNERHHCINHLTVGQLGNQEIIVITTDSGNVTAYYTSAINLAVKRTPYHLNVQGSPRSTELRPFFSQWVWQSAWGISIHKEARMIAVSANTPNERQPYYESDECAKISVFAFALTEATAGPAEDNDLEDSDVIQEADHTEWHIWTPTQHDTTPARDRNYKIVLCGDQGHEHNIPNITFVNSSEDVHGEWLISTDIRGETKLWQIWRMQQHKSWNFKTRPQGRSGWSYEALPGWSVLALDLSSFRPTSTTTEFIGARNAAMYYGYNARGDSYDITRIVHRQTPGNGENHPLQDLISGAEVSEVQHQHYNDLSDDEDESVPHDGVERDIASSGRTGEAEINLPELTPAVRNNISSHSLASESHRFMSAAQYTSDDTSSSEEDMDIGIEDDSEDDLAMDSEHVTSVSPGSASSTFSTFQLAYDVGIFPAEQKSESRIPAIALMHCSATHVRLLGGLDAKTPHIFCARILHQNLPQGIEHHHVHHEYAAADRLNMTYHIPELGIVLIATQIGRVAVCTLTRRADGLLGLRVDWVLPTRAQERAGARPLLMPLMGMAVSPIQGRMQYKREPRSEHDEQDTWMQDRVVDGVSTTFDREVVVFDPLSSPGTSNLTGDGRRTGSSRRKNAAKKAKAQEPQRFHTEQRPWSRPEPTWAWQACENGPRYRLMLTYLDMTVLTYEISRDVESGDVAI